MVSAEKFERNAYAPFKNMDLQDICQDWDRNNLTTRAEMKQHFSTKIQMDKMDQSLMRQQEQANTVLE